MLMDTKKIFELKQEIQKLLRENPDLIPLQQEIDRRLKNAGNNHNRLVIIDQMMKEKVSELKCSLDDLAIELNTFLGKK